MDRRRFLLISLGVIAAPLVSEAQQAARKKIPHIGVLSGNRRNNDPCLDALRLGLRRLGYVEGQTHVLEVRWAEARSELYSRLAAELVALNVDLIVSFTGGSLDALKQATTTIPIVMAASLYPVEEGFVASLARPGGNITGLAVLTPELMEKRVQILKEAVPAVAQIAVIRQPGHAHDLIVGNFEAAARQLGVHIDSVQVKRGEELPAAFDTAVRRGAQAVMTTQGPFFSLHRALIADLALKHRLPSLSGEAAAPEAGTLMFYGPHIWEACGQSARYVDRIVKGAKPSELPVERPTKIDLIINLKTAKALGLTIPPSLLARADQVIE